MTEFFEAVIRGELVIVLLLAAICMGAYLGRGNR